MVFFYTLYPHPFRMGTKSSSQIFDKGTSPFLQTHFLKTLQSQKTRLTRFLANNALFRRTLLTYCHV